jgi:hypothetical protein
MFLGCRWKPGDPATPVYAIIGIMSIMSFDAAAAWRGPRAAR